MEAISGVFKTRARAENAVKEALKAGISSDKITLLTPGTVDQVNKEMQSVAVDTTEQPGMGKAMGAVAGGGVASWQAVRAARRATATTLETRMGENLERRYTLRDAGSQTARLGDAT